MLPALVRFRLIPSAPPAFQKNELSDRAGQVSIAIGVNPLDQRIR